MEVAGTSCPKNAISEGPMPDTFTAVKFLSY